MESRSFNIKKGQMLRISAPHDISVSELNSKA
jgi:hypothetical protein